MDANPRPQCEHTVPPGCFHLGLKLFLENTAQVPSWSPAGRKGLLQTIRTQVLEGDAGESVQVPRHCCFFLGPRGPGGAGGGRASGLSLSQAHGDHVSSVLGMWPSCSCWCSVSASWWPVSCICTLPGSRYVRACVLCLTSPRQVHLWPPPALLAGQVGLWRHFSPRLPSR